MSETKNVAPVTPKPDEDFLCEEADRVYGAAFEAMKALAATELEWDMSKIAQVVDEIESILEKENIPICHPWEDEDGNICYSLEDRCKHCTHIEF